MAITIIIILPVTITPLAQYVDVGVPVCELAGLVCVVMLFVCSCAVVSICWW